jgi:hypothetical protein
MEGASTEGRNATMTLEDVVSWLEQEFGADSAARVEIIPSQADAAGERVPLPIRDVSVDASDEEVHLLVNSSPWDEAAVVKPPMTVSTLLVHLKALVGREKYNVVSGTWREIDEEHLARIDWPFEGIATNEDETVVAFVERIFSAEAG